ncbi:MAG: type II toxin-antitoxin system prevent-host-death family antitoxin [Thermoanaerobaculia bacterium]
MAGPTPVVGVRALRARLSAYLREVADGRTVTIGDRRRRPIARIIPVKASADLTRIEKLVQRGLAQAGAGKRGTQPPVKPRRTRRRVADLVIEDRR